MLIKRNNLIIEQVARALQPLSNIYTDRAYRFKSVFRRQRGDLAWRLDSAQIEPVANISEDSSEVYPNAMFFISFFEFSSLRELLDHLSHGGVMVHEDYPCIEVSPVNKWHEILIPSHATDFDYPIRYYSCDISAERYADESLVAYGLEYFESFDEKVESFLDYDKHDKRCLHLAVEDTRSRIKLDGNDTVNLECGKNVGLVGEITYLDKKEKVGVGTNANFSLAEAVSCELWLIDADNAVHDYISTSVYPYRYDLKVKEKTRSESLLDLIQNGEGSQCEFKRWVSVKNSNGKAAEIYKTACAFSNAKGGELIIGVTDHGEIVGLDNQLSKEYKMNFDEALHQYQRDIEKLLYENLTEANMISVVQVELKGFFLIVVQVPPSDNWNFVSASDTPFVRKGATNMNGTRFVAMAVQGMRGSTNGALPGVGF